MSYIDVHAHLCDARYNGDIAEVLRAMRQNSVFRVINSGYDVASSEASKKLSEESDGFYFSAGVHPDEAGTLDALAAERLIALAKDEKCVAIGEIGLDYHNFVYPKEVQYRAFETQMEIADELGLPFVVHSRDASGEMLKFLKDRKSLIKKGFLMHCYSESEESAKEYLALGAYFSFGGVITFKNAKKEGIIASIPLDRLLSETDSPYLSPEPFRGTTNDPSRIPLIVKKLASAKGVNEEEMISAVNDNADRLFFKLKCN